MIAVGGNYIGRGAPCFVIAELGVNHNGDAEMAKALVDAAVAAGANAVKFQTFSAERLVTPDAPKADYQSGPAARRRHSMRCCTGWSFRLKLIAS